MEPVHVLIGILGIVIIAPAVAAVLAFTPDPTLRKIARWMLALAWVACAAAVIGCIWLSGRRSAGIGNHVFLLIAIVPGVLGFVWFMIWRAARRHEYLKSLPPDLRRVEELADIEEGLERVRRELRDKERRVDSFFISSRERAKLRAEIPLLRVMVKQLETERAKRLPQQPPRSIS